MKYQLIDMVQELLSAMDSDEVDSISDTTEAMQVAHCVRTAYYNLIEDIDPPQHYVTFNLTTAGSTAPTIMTLPSEISKLSWIKYNKIAFGETNPFWEEIRFLDKHEFFDRMYRLNTDETNIDSYSYQSSGIAVPIIYLNDRQPTYYTSFDNDGTILFDSLDTSVDTTNLSTDKTVAYGRKSIDFSLANDFVPDLEEPMFSRLLNEAKVLAFAELKSVDHAIANRNANRSRNRAAKDKFRTKHLSDFDALPHFGRIK